MQPTYLLTYSCSAYFTAGQYESDATTASEAIPARATSSSASAILVEAADCLDDVLPVSTSRILDEQQSVR